MFHVHPPVRPSRTRGNHTIDRVTPNAGMRICTGAGGGVGVGTGVGEGRGVGVGVCVGKGVGVGVGEGVHVIAGTGRAAISSPRRYRFCPMSHVFSSE